MQTERPSHARSYWSYRLIDGRKCWYEGKPMLSKSSLHWSPARTAKADDPEREPILPASRYNFLDAQASPTIPTVSKGVGVAASSKQ